jgi:tetratricopeptide (TPR) repeat protein
MGRKPKRGTRAARPAGKASVAAAIERWFALATAAQARGAFGEARTYYRKITNKDPGLAPVWHALAGACFQLGEALEAAAALERACSIEPENVEYLSDLGGVYLSLGNLAVAERTLRTVTELEPDYGQAQYNLSSVLYQSGKLAEAIAELTRLIHREPTFAEAHFNLGIALRDIGNWSAAVRAFEAARKLQPDTARTYLELARLESDAHIASDAIRHYREYLKRVRNEPEITVELAELLHRDGQTDAAAALLERAAHDDPGSEKIALSRAGILHNAGKLPEAEATYFSALERFPDATAAAVGLSRLRRFTDASDPLVARLRQTLDNPASTEAQAEPVHFALGKIYDDLGQYEQAFSHYAAGNAIHRRSLDYDRHAAETETDALIETFSAAVLKVGHPAASDSDKPVLVVGMPRSGTTLTEQIIAAHGHAAGAGELAFFPALARHLPALTGSDDGYPACWRRVGSDLAQQIINQYLELLDRHARDAVRVTDKMPANYRHVGLFRSLFRRARVVICRRDPRDVALSIYFQYFRDHHDYAWSLGDIAHCYVQHERLLKHWLAADSTLTHEIRYADLVGDHEQTARRLITAVDLEWDPQCLEFHKVDRDVKTASNWQVRQPIYATSVERWRAYEACLGEFVTTLQDERARYGIEDRERI